MPDPTNPNESWQQVPHTSGDPAAPHVPPPVATDYPPPTQGYPPVGYPPPVGSPPNIGAGLSDNAAAAISYITFIPAIIFLVMDPYKRVPFIRFHSLQCLFFNAVVWVFYIVLSIVWGLVAHVLPFMALFGLVIWPLVWLFFAIIWAFCVYKASQGEWFKLPIIGDIALAQAKK